MQYHDAVQALSRGAYTPAIATFLGHLAHNRTDGNVWLYLGVAYSEAGLLDDALHALHVADLLLEDDAELLEALGVTHLRRGDYREARSYLEAAMSHRDRPESVFRNLAMLHLKQGDTSTALEVINRGVAAHPEDVATLVARGVVMKALLRS